MRNETLPFLLLLLLPMVGEAEVLRGTVVALSDGDTVTVLDASKTAHRIRLTGIDAPERRQPFSTRSTQNLSRLVFQKEVEVHWTKRDHYGRILGKVMVADPRCDAEDCPKTVDANLEQIAEGLAWWYRRYAKEQPQDDRLAYEEAEALARSRKLGLWADPSPTPPWEWRRKPKKVKPRRGAEEKRTSEEPVRREVAHPRPSPPAAP